MLDGMKIIHRRDMAARRITRLAYRSFEGSGSLLPPLRLEQDIGKLSSLFEGPATFFGHELRVQHHIDENYPALEARSVYLRPASEPLLLSVFPLLQKGWKSFDALKASSILMGAPVQSRTERMQGICADGNRVEFEALSVARRWQRDLEMIDHAPASAIDRAAAYYMRALLAHPLRDGNGRLARALIYAPLLKEGFLDKPILSLNAVFSLHKDEVADEIVHLGMSGNWPRFLMFFRDMLGRAVEIGLKIASD